MNAEVRYPFDQRLRFVFGYIFAKFAVLWEVRRPRWRFFAYEMKYSLGNGLRLISRAIEPRLYSGPPLIETIFGTYRVRPGTHDAAITSPAFERRDRQRLDEVLQTAGARGRPVFFLDIGANIGAFSVSAALRFPDVHVCSFEPLPENLEALRENLRLNGLSRTQVFPFALSAQSGHALIEFSPKHPGDSRLGQTGVRIETRRLDEILPVLPAGSLVVLKIDVEGHEGQVLRGFGAVFKDHPVVLMIEDMFEAEALYAQLREMGLEFAAKLSPYNSWWTKD